MKKLALVLMSVALFGVLPAFGADDSIMQKQREEGLRQCAFQAESIQEKISRLQKEIKMGKSVYTADELKRLEDKLKEANRMLEELTRN